uniref:Uncharacterized protein n=1 Tax=Anguilla anguilla TaxID=7936 RepID=A0A0E9PK08_ANGAN
MCLHSRLFFHLLLTFFLFSNLNVHSQSLSPYPLLYFKTSVKEARTLSL